MALVAQGVSLQRSSYSQCLVYMHRTRHRIADMIRGLGDTTHTIATWLRPRSTQTAAQKKQMGRQAGHSRNYTFFTRIARIGTGIVKRKRHPAVGDKHLPDSGHKRSKKSLADDPLRGVRRYFKEYPPRKLPWEKERFGPHKRQ